MLNIQDFSAHLLSLNSVFVLELLSAINLYFIISLKKIMEISRKIKNFLLFSDVEIRTSEFFLNEARK